MTIRATSATSCASRPDFHRGLSGASRVLRVLLVVKKSIVGVGLEATINSVSDLQVIEVFNDISATASQVRHMSPDLMVVDIKFLQRLMVDGVGHLDSLGLRCAVLTSGGVDISTIPELRELACVYISPDDNEHDIRHALWECHFGAGWVSPTLGLSALEFQRRAYEAATESGFRVTLRESMVLPLVASGCTAKEIGLNLNISERAAKIHISSLLKKFGARNRAHLVYLACASPCEVPNAGTVGDGALTVGNYVQSG